MAVWHAGLLGGDQKAVVWAAGRVGAKRDAVVLGRVVQLRHNCFILRRAGLSVLRG